jgi:hypothetical protein
MLLESDRWAADRSSTERGSLAPSVILTCHVLDARHR